MQRYRDLQDIIAILGVEELSEDDKIIVGARAASSAFSANRSSSPKRSRGAAGKYVPLKETIAGFKELVEGKLDDLPEQAFYMCGNIDEAKANAEAMAARRLTTAMAALTHFDDHHARRGEIRRRS